MSRGEEFLGCSQDVLHRNQPVGGSFCAQENWQSAVLLLSQELQLLGFPTICPDGGNFDVIALVNNTWDLAQNYRTTLKTVSDLECQVLLKTVFLINIIP